MTVSYTAQVATSSKGFGCFWRILFRWRGSVYKVIYHEFAVYITLYTVISLVYRLALQEAQKRTFEALCVYMGQAALTIPLSFVLGFYVNLIMGRWWSMYITIPWPDTIAVIVSTGLDGQEEDSRIMRRTLMRYMNLTFTLAQRMICPSVKKRFPSFDHLIEMGLLTDEEKLIIETQDRSTLSPNYWIPIVWAGLLVSKARRLEKIKTDQVVKALMDEFAKFRGGCGGLLGYDRMSVPLVYTQVVTIAVYSFFLTTLLGSQFLDPSQDIPGHSLDLYVPVFTLLQFLFYVGWLKVAETLINPFGEDDDDFEINSLIDRNITVSYMIVDAIHSDHPTLVKDLHFDEVVPLRLPYTVAAGPYRPTPDAGSTANIKVSEKKQEIVVHDVHEDLRNATSAPVDRTADTLELQGRCHAVMFDLTDPSAPVTTGADNRRKESLFRKIGSLFSRSREKKEPRSYSVAALRRIRLAYRTVATNDETLQGQENDDHSESNETIDQQRLTEQVPSSDEA